MEGCEVPELAADAVLVKSVEMPKGAKTVLGYDFEETTTTEEGGDHATRVLERMLYTGFQATSFGQAAEEINKMIRWRLSDEAVGKDEPEEHLDPEFRKGVKCKIFLGYTSNLISSGVRESIKYLVKNKMVDCVVTTAGGIEEDLIKCLGKTYLGDFALKGTELRSQGLNRIGNLLVPNDNYCSFEDWIMPVLDAMLEEQKKDGVLWTPSRVIARLGKEINNEESVCYWAWKNSIPMYCPALTDGSIGDMLYFHSYKNPGLVVDLVQDIRSINTEAVKAAPRKTGMIILGGGVCKHHICNANLMRNGADYAVYVNTAQEFDGSDSGARPDEAKSWGKIKQNAKPVKVYGDATIIFPLLVSQTFAKR
ncbi:deoxyhypusine synthase [Chloropicon primus]|uniref:deoxyhypusine synthase n=1 Tax=Chloropicon primus TaxID=1764295 RepID=A0A5B8MAZ8_9CHLO|nr:deoxyhypusine synthase [Chloropicon primus]UPQ96746.1 deoxyhypusine synthase [Chloropicon primus]|eukprot:QDZ17527.1 deoxyhypusine synthase [Chloropicon primus]